MHHLISQLSDIRGFRYLALADTIEKGIAEGTFQTGDKLPSI